MPAATRFPAILTCWLLLSMCVAPASAAAPGEKSFVEVRTYTLVDRAAEAKLDAYLRDALLPALNRLGLGPVGAFAQASPKPDDPPQVLLVVTGKTLDALVLSDERLTADAEHQRAAEDYLSQEHDSPLVARISSELLTAFDAWPETVVPAQKKSGAERFFELRSYESPTEQLGHLKVEMFNSGETPIFLDAGIIPVFMGRVLVGERRPNLTYLTVYDSPAVRDEAWRKFLEHPEWDKLKRVERYRGTVSKIYSTDWTPKPYSDL